MIRGQQFVPEEGSITWETSEERVPHSSEWEMSHPVNTPTQLAFSSDHPLMRGANAYPELPAEWVHKTTGERRPVTEAWRAMSRDEWEAAQSAGVIHSDERHNLFGGHEGTNASPVPATARGYLDTPANRGGFLVHLQVHPDEKWFSSSDGNLRTRNPIPISRVIGAQSFGEVFKR